MARGADWIDATMTFGHAAGTWPGDAKLTTDWTARLGDRGPLGVNLSAFRSSPHNGTHADAPFHVLAKGGKSETLPLEAFIGPCIVVDARRGGDLVPAGAGDAVVAAKATRVLFKTREGPVPSKFPKGFRGLEPGLVERLVAAQVRLIGTDAPSVDRADLNGLQAHRILFEAGAYNLENLDLEHVTPGAYDLFAPPLKVDGLCAAPVRALLRPTA